MSDTPAKTSSTKPYLLRAIYEWCTDNGLTPYVAVFVNAQVRVPIEYVKNHEIVLNVSFEATQGLKIDNEAITFRARFAGVARDIFIPVDNVVAVYARENGQGMAFPLTPELQQQQQAKAGNLSAADEPDASSESEQTQAGEIADTPKNRATTGRKPKLSTVAGNGQEAQGASAKAAAKRKPGTSKPTNIHAVKSGTLAADGASSESDVGGAPEDPPRGPKDPKGGGGASRPSLKRIK